MSVDQNLNPLDGVDVFGQGAGRIDVGRAVGQDVIASPAVVSAGRAAWPHDDDEPSTHTVTYSNPGPAPVALSLTTTTLGPDGQPAPAGMFTLMALLWAATAIAFVVWIIDDVRRG